jgi:hypothetical protein
MMPSRAVAPFFRGVHGRGRSARPVGYETVSWRGKVGRFAVLAGEAARVAATELGAVVFNPDVAADHRFIKDLKLRRRSTLGPESRLIYMR